MIHLLLLSYVNIPGDVHILFSINESSCIDFPKNHLHSWTKRTLKKLTSLGLIKSDVIVITINIFAIFYNFMARSEKHTNMSDS